MHRHHDHAEPGHHGPGAGSGRLALVLGLTALYAAAEVIGGWLSGSLALLADAGHMVSDVLALGLALLAAWAARRPPDQARTYGYQRAEILAALVNGVTLVVISIFILREAWVRFRHPPEVDFRLMAAVAAGGLLVNLVCAGILAPRRSGLNVRAAYLHVLGDLLGSVGALAAAGLIAAFGWQWADPAASVLIGVVIVFSAVRLVLASLNVLLEGAPTNIEIEEVRRSLAETRGVCGVHDLHLWTLGGDSPLLTAHLVLDHTLAATDVLREATGRVRSRFGIAHATLQTEPPDFNIVRGLEGPSPESARGPGDEP